MTNVTIAILGVAVIFAETCIVFAAVRIRNHRRQVRLSIAFDRARAVRTRDRGLPESPFSFYAEPIWTFMRDRGGK
jgi:hypothetical protein